MRRKMDNNKDNNRSEIDDIDFGIDRYFDEDEELEDGESSSDAIYGCAPETLYEGGESEYYEEDDVTDEAYGVSYGAYETDEPVSEARYNIEREQAPSADNTADIADGQYHYTERGTSVQKRNKRETAQVKRKSSADNAREQAPSADDSAKARRERQWPGLRSNLRVMLVLFTTMFAVLLVYFVYSVTTFGGRWFNNPYNPRIQSEKDRVVPGNILDRNQVVLASTDSDGERVYNDDRHVRTSVSHVVGDNYGLTTTGAESFFSRTLLGFDAGLFERVYSAASGGEARGESVVLTIDAELTAYASDAFRDYRGALVLMNYETGEVLAMVSHPEFDPENMDAYRPKSDSEKRSGESEGETSALVNRALMGRYTPGSIFKVITAAAALNSLAGIDEREFECDGPLAFDGESGVFLENVHISPEEDKKNRNATPSPRPSPTPSETPVIAPGSSPDIMENLLLVRDNDSDYHGDLDFEEAFTASCNVTFGRIGMELGAARISSMAQSFGFGEDFLFSDLILYPSNYELPQRAIDVAWSAAGQYRTTVTPMHMCMIAAGIANKGVMMEPRMLYGTISSREFVQGQRRPSIYKRAITETVATKLTALMKKTVESGTGARAALSNWTVCGKTGSAQISSDREVNSHAWFIGFIEEEEHPLAIAVVLEKAGSGGRMAAPVAKEVFERAIRLGY